MSKEERQVLNIGYSYFDRFNGSFCRITGCDELRYHTDAIFHLLLPREHGTERRFKGGLWLWALWVLGKLASQTLSSNEHHQVVPFSNAPFGFRFLTTPAHHDSLSPVFDQIPSGLTCQYGHDREDEKGKQRAIDAGLVHTLSILGRGNALAALLRAVHLSRQIRGIVRQIPEIGRHTIPTDTWPRLAEILLRHQVELAHLRKSSCPHKAVFLTYELIPESKAWVQWARQSGARVIHIMHGQRLPTYQVTLATDILLFSKVDESWFLERVNPDVRLSTFGHPRLEMLRKQIAPPNSVNSERLPRIAFFSQPAEGDYSRELRMNDWRILTGLKGRAEVRFRMHPREDREVALADLRHIGAEFIEFSEAGLKEDLTWCDAVASSWSTVSMEAAACGRGVFWACSTPEKYEASQELRDHGIGVLIQNSGQWDPYLVAWHEGSWTTSLVVSDQRLRELGMIGDMDRPWLQRLGLEPADGES